MAQIPTKFLEDEKGYIAPATTSDAVAITTHLPGIYSLSDLAKGHYNLCKSSPGYSATTYTLDSAISELNRLYGLGNVDYGTSKAGTRLTFFDPNFRVQEWIYGGTNIEPNFNKTDWSRVDLTIIGTSTGNLEVVPERDCYVYLQAPNGGSRDKRPLDIKLKFLLNGKVITQYVHENIGNVEAEITDLNHAPANIENTSKHLTNGDIVVRIMDSNVDLPDQEMYGRDYWGDIGDEELIGSSGHYGSIQRLTEYYYSPSYSYDKPSIRNCQKFEKYQSEFTYRIMSSQLERELGYDVNDFENVEEGGWYKGARQILNVRADFGGLVGFGTIHVLRIPDTLSLDNNLGDGRMSYSTCEIADLRVESRYPRHVEEDRENFPENYLIVRARLIGDRIRPTFHIPKCLIKNCKRDYYRGSIIKDLRVKDDSGLDISDFFELENTEDRWSSMKMSDVFSYTAKDYINLDKEYYINLEIKVSTSW